MDCKSLWLRPPTNSLENSSNNWYSSQAIGTFKINSQNLLNYWKVSSKGVLQHAYSSIYVFPLPFSSSDKNSKQKEYSSNLDLMGTFLIFKDKHKNKNWKNNYSRIVVRRWRSCLCYIRRSPQHYHSNIFWGICRFWSSNGFKENCNLVAKTNIKSKLQLTQSLT